GMLPMCGDGSVGKRLQFGRVEHRGAHALVDEVQLDIQHDVHAGEGETAVRKHPRQSVQTALYLVEVPPSVQRGEGVRRDVLTHGIRSFSCWASAPRMPRR